MAREISIRVTADATQAQKVLGQTEQSLKGITSESQRATAAVGNEKSGLLGAMGKLGAVLLTVGAGRAVSRTVEWAGHLTDLADKTGMTTEALQRLAFVGTQSGVSIDSLANGIVRLQRNLSTDKGAQKAIEALGLSVSDLLAMAPDQMFIRLSEAVRGLEDPAKRTTAAWEVLGRSSAELMPVMVSDVKALSESVHVTANEHTAAMNQMGDNYARLKFAAQTALGDLVGGLADLKIRGDKFAREHGLTWENLVVTIAAWGLKLINSFIEMGNAIAMIPKAFLKASDLSIQYAKALYEGVKTWLVDKFMSVVDAAKGMTDQVAGFFKELYRKVVGGSYVPDMVEGVREWFAKLEPFMVVPTEVMVDAVANAFMSLGRKLDGGWRRLLQVLTPLIGMMKEYVKNLLNVGAAQTEAQKSAAALSSVFGILTMAAEIAIDMYERTIARTRELRREMAELGLTVTQANALMAELGFRRGNNNELGFTLEAWRNTLELVDHRFGQLGDALRRFGGVAPAALQPMIQQLLRSTALTAQQRDLLEGMSGERSWEQLQEAAERYGIAIDSLGTRFQQNRIGAQFDDIFTDFMNLTEGGADAEAVLRGMADEVQALLTDAMRFGTALPEFMRPMLTQMVQAGLLTDQFGNRLEDLSRLSFTDSIESSFQRMADILAQIRDLLARSIPDAGDFAVRSVMTSMDKLSAATGGAATGGGDQRTHGLPMTGGGAMTGGAGGNVTVTVPVMLDGRVIARSVANVARQLGYG